MHIIGIGETVLDIVFKNDQPQAAVPGGSTFNAMISLGRAGADAAIVTEVGDDHVGDITCDYMRRNGVSDRYVVRHPGVKSHISLAFLNEQNDANYSFYKDHRGVTLGGPMPRFAADNMVLFGSFFAINPAIRSQVKALLTAAHDAGATLYYDINFRKPHVADLPEVMPAILENMRLATIVRGSDEDFGLLFGETDPDLLYERYIRPCCPFFILTRGARSIELRTPSLKMTFPVETIETVSTIGAGDNFNAGFLYRLGQIDRPLSGTHLLDSLTHDEWAAIIAMGQRFAQNVCCQLGNSIDPTFATTWARKEE